MPVLMWLATSPHGPVPYKSWRCVRCPDRSTGSPYSADPDAIRAAARAHVEGTGHYVTVYRGTTEMLYPLATTAATPEGST